jgi:hypothetical protein
MKLLFKSILPAIFAFLALPAAIFSQGPDEHLMALKPLTGRTWEGQMNAPNGSLVSSVILTFEYQTGNNVIRYTRSNPKLKSSGEGFIYWDDIQKKTAFFFIEKSGVFQTGFITAGKGIFTFEGKMAWPSQKLQGVKQVYDFRNTFELVPGNSLVDRFYQNAFGHWRDGHVIAFSAKNDEPESNIPQGGFSVATYASDSDDARQVKLLIASLRKFGGRFSRAEVLVCVVDSARKFFSDFYDINMKLVNLTVSRKVMEYPLALKAFAAAAAEREAAPGVKTLAWFDPGTLILDEPACLEAGEEYSVVARPVTLRNNIGVPAGNEPNLYWMVIYKRLGLDWRTFGSITTIADNSEILPYYNCEVFAVNPSAAIFRTWADQLSYFLENNDYQEKACVDFTRRLFLHQAVLTGVILAKVPKEKIRELTVLCGYPFNQHSGIPAGTKVNSLNECRVIIFDRTLLRDPGWINSIPFNGDSREWLVSTLKSLGFSAR